MEILVDGPDVKSEGAGVRLDFENALERGGDGKHFADMSATDEVVEDGRFPEEVEPQPAALACRERAHFGRGGVQDDRAGIAG